MIVFVWGGGGHFSAHYTYKNMKQVSKFRNFVLGVEFCGNIIHVGQHVCVSCT